MPINIRIEKEKLEKTLLSPYATKSSASLNRDKPEEPCTVRTCFERDRDRIIHCKSFRRLKHKTQVFINPLHDHYRTRLNHTLEVAQIARTIAVSLRLNEALTEAIALGHDLGHPPFGHSGEAILNEICPFEFEHNLQSLRVVERLENDGLGLNLTFEVRDGIKNHCTGYEPSTLEGKIVFMSDKIAYINHDIEDAIRGRVLKPENLPGDLIEVLGDTHSKRINTMIVDIIENSYGKDGIYKSREIEEATMRLRAFMFDNVYHSADSRKEEAKAHKVVTELYQYFCRFPEKMPSEYGLRVETEGLERSVCDYIAGMTDNFALNLYKNLFIPGSWI